MNDLYSQLENDKNNEELIQEFVDISKLYSNKGADKNEQDKLFLDCYVQWLNLKLFKTEFCEKLLELINDCFSDDAQESSKLPAQERRFFAKKKELKEIFEYVKNSEDQKASLLKFFYQKNAGINVSDKLIAQILSKKTDGNIQSLAKFKLRICDLYSGTFDKKTRESFWTTYKRLSDRVTKLEQYKFTPDAFIENPKYAYPRLYLLSSVFRLWYCKKFDKQKVDKSDKEIYDIFSEQALEYFSDSPKNKAVSLSLDSVISLIKTGVKTPFQLTTLNKRVYDRQNLESGYLSSYLKYLLQLWSEGHSREAGFALPRLNHTYYPNKERQLALDICLQSREGSPLLAVLLEGRLSDCVVRISNGFFYNSSYDQLLDSIIEWSCTELGISVAKYKSELEKAIDEFILNYEKKNSLTIKELITLTSSDLPLENDDYFKSNCLIHLLITQSISKSINFNELIQQSCEQEITCLNRSVFLDYCLPEVFGGNFEDAITVKYKKFKQDVFVMAKAWLLLLNTSTEFNGTVDSFVHENAGNFFSSKLPISKDSFGNEKLNSEISSLCKVFNIDTKELKVFPFEDVFFYSESELVELPYFKDKKKHNFSVKVILDLLSGNYLQTLWEKIIGKYDESIVYHVLMSKFIDSKSKKTTALVLNGNRNKLVDRVYGNYFEEFVKSISSKSFNQVFLEFDDTFNDDLTLKLEAVSNLSFLGDARFQLITDRNNIPVKLGEGGFGCVYKAKDLLFDSIVAIKLIPRWHDSAELEKQMLREASIMRQCQHKNVVTVYDVSSFNSKLFVFSNQVTPKSVALLQEDHYIHGIIMEYIPHSQTLDALIQGEGMPYKSIYNVLIQVSEGLQNIHSLGIVHGDIKPQNILIDNDFNVKLLDFGVSTKSNNHALGSSNSIFISEKARVGDKLEKKDDLYSLAIVTIYLLSSELLSYISKSDDEIKHKLFCALYVIAKGMLSNDKSIDAYNKSLERVEDRSTYNFLSGLKQFSELRNDENERLIIAILQVIAPVWDEQKQLLDSLFFEFSFTKRASPTTIITNTNDYLIETPIERLSVFKNVIKSQLVGSQSKIFNKLKLYGEEINTLNLNKVLKVDFFEFVSDEFNPRKNLLFSSDEYPEDKKDNQWRLYPKKSETIWLIDQVDKYIFSVITDDVFCENYRRNNKNYSSFSSGQTLSEYFRVEMDFNFISDEIKLFEIFYPINRKLCSLLYEFNHDVDGENVIIGDGLSTIKDMIKSICVPNEENGFLLEKRPSIFTTSLKLLNNGTYSPLSCLFDKLKNKLDDVMESFQKSLPQSTLIIASLGMGSYQFLKWKKILNSNSNQDDFCAYLGDEYNLAGKKAIWELINIKLSNLENRILSGFKVLNVIDLFLLESELNPQNLYLEELKLILNSFSKLPEFKILSEELSILSDCERSNYYYKMYRNCIEAEKISLE